MAARHQHLPADLMPAATAPRRSLLRRVLAALRVTR